MATAALFQKILRGYALMLKAPTSDKNRPFAAV
jgi:hypothetical protein